MSDGDKGNAIMIAIGKAKKKPSFGGGMAASHDEPDADDAGGGDDTAASEDEVAAYKAMKGADSPQAGADALKLFIKLCTEGGY